MKLGYLAFQLKLMIGLLLLTFVANLGPLKFHDESGFIVSLFCSLWICFSYVAKYGRLFMHIWIQKTCEIYLQDIMDIKPVRILGFHDFLHSWLFKEKQRH